MDPEASVSSLVFHRPDGTYFSVGDDSDSPPSKEAFQLSKILMVQKRKGDLKRLKISGYHSHL
jgi:hypothetical protein